MLSEREIERKLNEFAEQMEELHGTESGYGFWEEDGGAYTDWDNFVTKSYEVKNWRTNETETRSYKSYASLDKRLVPGVGYVSLVEQFGGEGQGDTYYIILKLEVPDADPRYFKIDGFYASHYGRDLDGPFYEVVPREKVVTVYERKK